MVGFETAARLFGSARDTIVPGRQPLLGPHDDSRSGSVSVMLGEVDLLEPRFRIKGS